MRSLADCLGIVVAVHIVRQYGHLTDCIGIRTYAYSHNVVAAFPVENRLRADCIDTERIPLSHFPQMRHQLL